MPGLTLIAATTYALIALLGLLAAVLCDRHMRPATQLVHWLVFALFFVSLAVLRLADFEEVCRQALRQALAAQEVYGERRNFQGPIVAIALFAGAALCFVAWWTWPSLQRWPELGIWLARMAVGGYVLLIALRVVSLHAMDQILYAGPLRLNWLLDAGLAATALLATFLYLQGLRNSGRKRRRSGGPKRSDRH